MEISLACSPADIGVEVLWLDTDEVLVAGEERISDGIDDGRLAAVHSGQPTRSRHC